MTLTDEVKQKVSLVMNKNRVSGCIEGKNFYYTQPSKKTYPSQFFWDSAFHSIINIDLGDPEWAVKELSTLFSIQRDDGFIGHQIYWTGKRLLDGLITRYYKKCGCRQSPVQSCVVQPPVIGHAIHRLWHAGRKKDAEKLAKNAVLFLKWLEDNRADHDGLIRIIHPWESGMDALPCYDKVLGIGRLKTGGYMRKLVELLKYYNELEWDQKLLSSSGLFRVKDVGYNAITSEAYFLLSQVTGDRDLAEKGAKILDSIEKYMWDSKSELFYSLGPGGEMLNVKTVASLLPLILDISSDKVEALNAHILNKNEFWAHFPLPSVSMDEPQFNPKPSSLLLWRGPTWIATNWFVVRGLLKHNCRKIAEMIVKRNAALIRVHGLREQYNPITGAPGGAKDFGWSGLVLDMLYMLGEVI
ncbi:MAG: hypothetical protein QXL15_01010 [Candidatus Korarchaeota archaeon]